MRLWILAIVVGLLPSSAVAKVGAVEQIQKCISDYRQIANVKFGPENGRHEGFKFNGERLIFDRNMQLTFEALPNETINAEFQRISTQEKFLRQRIHELKRKSTPANRPPREMQEFIVIYRDGTRKSVRYTSNSFYEVSEEAGKKAIKGSKVFTEDIDMVLDIHTHPDQALRSDLFFTADDVAGSKTTKESIEQALGRKIQYYLIVAPICETCADVIVTSQL